MSDLDSPELDWRDAFKRDTYTLTNLKHFWRDLRKDFSTANERSDPTLLRKKFKKVGIALGIGAICGHSYCVYRGIFRPSLYIRYVLGSSVVGLAFSMPIFSFSKIKSQKYPMIYSIVIGGIWGGLIGFIHRGPQFIIGYSFLGISFYLIGVCLWYQLFKPLYYFHYLKWPEYNPPFWWPYQPVTALQIYHSEVEREKSNVIFEEDLKFWQNYDTQKEKTLRTKQMIKAETEFVKDTELETKKYLENPPQIGKFI